MPIVRLLFDELKKLSGIAKEEIVKEIPMIGADIERIEKDYMDVEFFPNRPDLFSVEGVSRALKGFLGIETGLVSYNVKDSGFKMLVKASVLEVRPYVVCGVVKDLELNLGSIESLMSLQELLHRSIGRNREKISLGVHDLTKVKPPFKYLAVSSDFSFVPLDYEEEMTMEEILERHPKGIEFGYILKGKRKYPLILDAEGNVLSFPPIINAELTRVTENTKDMFIEVTGTVEEVSDALNIVVSALAERGGRIESVLIISEKEEWGKKTPYLVPKTMEVSTKEVSSLIGINLSEKKCEEYCERMRLGAEVNNHYIEVKIPAYRCDILHPWDIIEDIAIGYGYDKIGAEISSTFTIGETNPVEERKEEIRDIMTGLGYFEVLTFSLTSEKKQREMMRRERDIIGKKMVKVASPISSEHTMLRCSILPNLLEILSLNKHRDLPQRIFEVGSVVLCEATHFPSVKVINFKEEYRLAAVSIHTNANFAEVRSVVDALIRERGMKGIKIADAGDNAFLEGRRAKIVKVKEGKKIGVFGELHPEVILNFGLGYPIVGLEIDLTYL